MTSAFIARTVALSIALGIVSAVSACSHRQPNLSLFFRTTTSVQGLPAPAPERRDAIPPSRRIWAKHTNRSRLMAQRRRRRRPSGNA